MFTKNQFDGDFFYSTLEKSETEFWERQTRLNQEKRKSLEKMAFDYVTQLSIESAISAETEFEILREVQQFQALLDL